MLDLGECLSLDTDNLPSAVYISPVQNPPPSNDGYFMFVGIEVVYAQTFGCACTKRKCFILLICTITKMRQVNCPAMEINIAMINKCYITNLSTILAYTEIVAFQIKAIQVAVFQ